MKVLSLFDGMSCGQLALNRLGIKVDTYYASEIDKYAMQVTQANFPETIQVGDVCNLDPNDFKDVDLMLAGSPCQGFSFAGKQLAFDDPRSALFFEFIRLLKEIKPKYFLLENVKMKKEYLQVISEQVSACYPEIPFGIEPIFINSSLVSAQNRQRYYWTNIPNITQPEERGIVLRDILEENPAENPVKDTKRNQRHYKNPDQKSLCMTATMYKGAGNNGMTLVPQNVVSEKRHAIIEKNLGHKIKDDTLLIGSSQKNAYLGTDKSSTLTEAMAKGGGQIPMVKMSKDKTDNLDKMTTKDGKSYCLTANYDAARPKNSMERKQRTMIPLEEGQELPEDISLVYDNEGKSHKPEHKEQDHLKQFKIKDETVTKYVPNEDGEFCDPYNKKMIKGDKSTTLRTNSSNGNTWVKQTSQKPEHIGTAVDINGHDILKRVYSPDGKSPTVNTCQGGNREPKVVAGAWRGRSLDANGKNVKWKETKPKQMLETRKDEKSNAVSTFTKDNLVVQFYREVRTEEAKKARKENRQKTGKDHTPFRAKELQPRDDGKVGTVTPALNNDHKISLTKNDTQEVYWRKLTPLECERLQTVPDNYTNHVSNTQRYKMLGNGWTIEVITHILKNMEL